MSNLPRQRLWKATGRLTGVLLVVWLLVSLMGPWFARDLNDWKFFGFPVGFWVVGQGALVAFLLIIVIYIVCMERIEARYRGERDAMACKEADAAAPRVAQP